MNSIVNFIIESGVSLSLLSILYILLLRKETFFMRNRIFLLISVVFSIILPFLKLKLLAPQPMILSEVKVTPFGNLLEVVNVYSHDFSGAIIRIISSSHTIIVIYLSVLFYFIGRLIFRIFQIVFLIKNNSIQYSEGYYFVFVEKEFSPFSFMNYIFINPNNKHTEGYDKMVAHEIEHVKQGHTYDVLILEVLTSLQWFNPFMWILRRAIRENHEFLADQAVLKSGVNPVIYKKLLLTQVVGLQFEMTNNFNSSLIKNRIKMISKIKSSKFANIKFLFGIIIAFALLITFACEKKESFEIQAPEQEMKLTIIEGKIKIEGSIDELEKVKSMFSADSGFDVDEDSLGNLMLVKKSVDASQTINGEPIFLVVEQEPVFPGGEIAMRDFIARTVDYPVVAQENEIQGKVYVSFIVTKDGTVSNAEIVRGVDPSLDNEAIRVINELPKWKPGYQRGMPVNVKYTVPIHFALQ